MTHMVTTNLMGRVGLNTDMRYSEIITEGRAIILDPETLLSVQARTRVWANLRNAEIVEILQRHDLRGWASPTRFFVWDANEGLHEQILDALIEIGEIKIEDSGTFTKCVISDQLDFSTFQYWEINKSTLREGEGIFILVDRFPRIFEYPPVKKALGTK